MKKILFFIFLIFSLISPFKIFASTGFIPGQIWYSVEGPKDGQTVNIYTVVWNGEDEVLQSKVEFYDKNVILGTREVSVPAKSIKEVYISWKVTAGDHTISARITSSTKGTEKEKITIKNNETEKDKFSIPVSIVTSDGKEATSSDIIESQIDKATSKVGDIIPSSVSTPVSNVFEKVDDFRNDTLTKIDVSKEETKEQIEDLKNKSEGGKMIEGDKVDLEEPSKIALTKTTDKPLAYIKYFALATLSLILNNKIIFYGLIILIAFFLLRFIYRKIRR